MLKKVLTFDENSLMKADRYKWILYLILITIVLSVLSLLYFNYRNYLLNKSNYIHKVQQSIDVATDNYFADRAKKKKEQFSFLYTNFIEKNIMSSTKVNRKTDSINIALSVHKKIDTFKIDIAPENVYFATTDSLQINTENELETILISITENPINLKQLDSIFKSELKRKNLKTNYQIKRYKNDVAVDSFSTENTRNLPLKTTAKSTFLKEKEKIEVNFSNEISAILKDGIIGVLLSLILSVAIVTSLFYLLHIIKKQKQIAEIKNDFISNITHEFKTPITTINTALEAIKSFNDKNDKQKTNNYIDISKEQLQKLHLMVEKILETASIDSENVLLNKEKINLVKLISDLVELYTSTTKKNIQFTTNSNEITTNIDVFHFKNAIQNLLDNAIKYGGNEIKIKMEKQPNKVLIYVQDSGSIPKGQNELIFDKFYRIPTGNKHNVKGFGIGLYYTKNIIKKHNGKIHLHSNKPTTFVIEIPLTDDK